MLQDTAMSSIHRVLVNISELRRVPVDPEDVYFLEAVGGDTLVRLRSKRPLRDVRPLGTLLKEFTPYGFLRIHRNHAVNLARIQEIRRRASWTERMAWRRGPLGIAYRCRVGWSP